MMKRGPKIFESAFDAFYLIAALIIGCVLLTHETTFIPGLMALVLVFGDAFHLIPRIISSFKSDEKIQYALGRGKQITSITMTVFYVLLWHFAEHTYSLDMSSSWNYIIYAVAAVRIVLCLLPQNRWCDPSPPVNWNIWRNIPFFILGMIVAVQFFLHRANIHALEFMWLAILLSFAFYLPVVLWTNKNPKLGMLMIPKTCTYLWMLLMCLFV